MESNEEKMSIEEKAELAETLTGIHRGLEEANEGKGRPIGVLIDEFVKKRGNNQKQFGKPRADE